jgi:predicted RNA methylase
MKPSSKQTNKKTGLKRDTIDKFYTKSDVAKECLENILEHIQIDSVNDLIIEPSAGNGSFITEILQQCKNTMFYDIEPEHALIKKADYLLLDFNPLTNTLGKIHVIGNPPFGRQSSLAIQFIKKSALIADSISFILPKSFKKDSMQKHFPMNFHLVFQSDLKDNSFIQDGNPVDVPCIFQIWQKREEERQVVAKLDTDSSIFQFVKQDETPDISFRRVGVNAGTIDDKELDKKSFQSHYFIKFGPTINKKEFIKKMRQIEYTHDNTVGPKSIGKQEIIREVNKLV